jgi:malonyl-CoA/methylmalonyl-CoA synthetase
MIVKGNANRVNVTPPLPLFERASRWNDRVAVAGTGGVATYARLLEASARGASRLLAGRADLEQTPVVFLVPPGWPCVAVQWAIWRAGGLAVPLSASQAPAEWEYILDDTQASVAVASDDMAGALEAVASRRGVPVLRAPSLWDHAAAPAPLPSVTGDRRATMLYTSGTTSRPKGVVATHRNLDAQVGSLTTAWEWTAEDRILNVLPLNHVHGLVNVLGCALWSGATCEFLSPFDPHGVWDRLAAGGLTLFMAVPTIYARLLAAWDTATPELRARWRAGASGLRLMVSGSAALPVSVLERWHAATGHVLLERYGMTEIGMALSNPLEGERRPGCVGQPLPGVTVRLVDEDGRVVDPGAPGEIEVRGDTVFLEYWRRPDATRDAFRLGWFRTGDVGVVESGSYRILGRQSVDIIKTGGYKVSALEIEEVLRQHPDILECAVVGVADEEWGERVAAAIVPRRGGEGLVAEGLRAWAAPRLAKYKLPTRVRLVDELPRNAMGKVVKPRVRDLFAAGPEGPPPR